MNNRNAARDRALPVVFAIAVFVLGVAPGAAAGQSSGTPQRPRTVRPAPDVDAPTMTNDMLVNSPRRLPEAWPVGAQDAQLRGAACRAADTPLEARREGETTDEVLPTLDAQSAVLPPLMLAVRRRPFVTRGDVVAATYVAGKQGGYDVELHLSEDGAARAAEFANLHPNACIALVAGGKVVWHPSAPESIGSGKLVLRGAFDLTQAAAIVELFASR